MNKELQDKAWAVLPNEFRKEVKEAYRIPLSNSIHDKGYNHALEYFFGEHNLTSDEETKDETNAIFSKVDKIGIDCEKEPNVENNIRMEVATAAMQGLLNATSVERFTLRIKPSAIAKAAVEYADALLAEITGTEAVMNGIIIDGKVYEAVHRGSCHCSDCDLYNRCLNRPVVFNALCMGFYDTCHDIIMFRFSKGRTEKLKQ